LLLGVALWMPRSAVAEHFDILLKVEASGSQGEAFMDTTPPIGGVNKRPVVQAKAGEPIRVTWRMKNVFPHDTQKAVTIHFFVVRESEVGQKPVPNPAGEAGLLDNSFVMDFAPKAAANGSLRLKIVDPGNYLVRVQSENTHEAHDHEHFSAIDVVVK
jgi:hypothetical protein